MRTSYLLGLAAALCLATLPGCGDDESTSQDPPEPPPPPDFIDLTTDTNRDGLLDENDAEGEDLWTTDTGAVFLPNLDDDDLDGVLDANDTWVNVTVELPWDALDLAPIMVKAWPEVPADATGYVVLDDAALPHVRIFKHWGDNNFELVAGANACDQNPGECDPRVIVLTADEIRAGAELRVEGLHVNGTPDSLVVDPATGEEQLWSGIIQLDYQVVEPSGAPITMEGNPEGTDRIQMRIAPWMMFGNLTPEIDTFMSNNVSFTLVSGLNAASEGTGVPYWSIGSWPSDHWTEDYFQSGWVSVPGPDGTVHGMRLNMPRPWGRTNRDDELPVRFLAQNTTGADGGYFTVYKEAHTGSTYDSHGNHDLLPGYENPANGQSFPYGRYIHGSSIQPETKVFYDAQATQGPSLEVDTSWLIVGHIDEVFSYVPASTERGWKLLVGSATLARTMLEQWQSEGHGDVPMFVGKAWSNGEAAEVTISEVLADTQLMTWSQQAQGNIDGMLATIIAEVGLTPDEIVEIPFLFERDNGGLVAFNPGTVNSLVYNNAIVIPDPFGPSINGNDAFKQDLIDRLGTGALQIGREGEGMDVFFADDWDWYHVLLGEVHCGTNISGPPQPDVLWWEAAK